MLHTTMASCRVNQVKLLLNFRLPISEFEVATGEVLEQLRLQVLSGAQPQNRVPPERPQSSLGTKSQPFTEKHDRRHLPGFPWAQPHFRGEKLLFKDCSVACTFLSVGSRGARPLRNLVRREWKSWLLFFWAWEPEGSS